MTSKSELLQLAKDALEERIDMGISTEKALLDSIVKELERENEIIKRRSKREAKKKDSNKTK